MKELQKKTILGTAHILRKVLMQKYRIFIVGNNITCNLYCKYRIGATLCAVETWFVSGV
jgi:hypothetical protein